jgi:hypothetical protein
MTWNRIHPWLPAGAALLICLIGIGLNRPGRLNRNHAQPEPAFVAPSNASFGESVAEVREPAVHEEAGPRILQYTISETQPSLFDIEPPRPLEHEVASTDRIPGQETVRPAAMVDHKYVSFPMKASVGSAKRSDDWEELFGLWTDSRLRRTEGFAFFRPDATFDACRLLLTLPDSGFSFGLKYRWSF